MSLAASCPGVRIVEVGPRDGLQNIKATIATSIKVELIQRLYGAGLRSIELTSVVSPRAIPQLSDCRELLSKPNIQNLIRDIEIRAPVLVPNLKGLDVALEHNLTEIAVFISVTEGFSKANTGCSVQEALDRAEAVARKAQSRGLTVRGYVSCIFACPYDGPTSPASVLTCVQRLLNMGCYEVSLGDTLGVGVSAQVQSLLRFLKEGGVPLRRLAGHFHDTYGQAVANVWTAYQCGVRVFDSSVAGLGGCPYAPGAKGNVATEDIVYMFEQAGVNTKVNLPNLVEVGAWISKQLKMHNGSRAGNALAARAVLSSPNSPVNNSRENPAIPKSKKLEWALEKSLEGLEVLRSGTNIKIVLNRPRNGNSLTIDMISNLTELFETYSADPKITRITIAARGKYFCTGMDLARGTTPVSDGRAASDAQFSRLTNLFQAIDKAPQVTIASVQGPAFGGGVGLAFACDIRIMSKNANMTLSEVKLGLCPATISRYVVREWGPAFSREAMLSGRAIPSSELAAKGSVHLVVDNDTDLCTVTDAYLRSLQSSAPHASSMCKELIRLNSIDGFGDSNQPTRIRLLFEKMMIGNEATHGLKQFQQGNRSVNWDQRALERAATRHKL